MKSTVQALLCLLSLTACVTCQQQSLEDVIDKLEKFAEENLPNDLVQLLRPSDRTTDVDQSGETGQESVSQKRLAADVFPTKSEDSDQETRISDNRVFAYNSLPRGGGRKNPSVGRLAAYNSIQKKLKTGAAQGADNRVFAYNSLPRKSGSQKSDEAGNSVSAESEEREVAPVSDNRVFAYNSLPRKSGVSASRLQAYDSIKRKLQQKGEQLKKKDNRVFAYNSLPQNKGGR